MWPFKKRKEWEKLGRFITRDELIAKLRMISGIEPHTRDKVYRCISQKDFEWLISYARPAGDRIRYKTEIYDCDNFAGGFDTDVARKWAELSRGDEALAFGYVAASNPEGVAHAFIWQLDDKGQIHYYEPQRDDVLTWLPVVIYFIEA